MKKAYQREEVRENNRLGHLGKTPWNKGLVGAYSKEQRKRISLSKRANPWTPPWKGKTREQSMKDKVSKTLLKTYLTNYLKNKGLEQESYLKFLKIEIPKTVDSYFKDENIDLAKIMRFMKDSLKDVEKMSKSIDDDFLRSMNNFSIKNWHINSRSRKKEDLDLFFASLRDALRMEVKCL